MKIQCEECKHYRQDAWCIVFPQGIPKDVFSGGLDCLYMRECGQWYSGSLSKVKWWYWKLTLEGGMIWEYSPAVQPGEDFCEIPFEQLRDRGESDGEIEIIL